MTNNEIEWRTSMYSNNETCVEVADLAGSVLVRDTKDRTRLAVRYTARAWRAFVCAVKAGELG